MLQKTVNFILHYSLEHLTLYITAIKIWATYCNIHRNYSIPTLRYLLTPSSRVLLETLIGLQLVKKFPAFYGKQGFVIAFKSARRLYLSRVPTQSILLLLLLIAIGLTPGDSSTVHVWLTPGDSSTVHIWLTPGYSSTVHIYTQTVHRMQRTEHR
jgi:hypothetical protein